MEDILLTSFSNTVKIQILLSNIKCIHLKYRTKGSTDIILHLRNESYHIMESLGTSGNDSLRQCIFLIYICPHPSHRLYLVAEILIIAFMNVGDETLDDISWHLLEQHQ